MVFPITKRRGGDKKDKKRLPTFFSKDKKEKQSLKMSVCGDLGGEVKQMKGRNGSDDFCMIFLAA